MCEMPAQERDGWTHHLCNERDTAPYFIIDDAKPRVRKSLDVLVVVDYAAHRVVEPALGHAGHVVVNENEAELLVGEHRLEAALRDQRHAAESFRGRGLERENGREGVIKRWIEWQEMTEVTNLKGKTRFCTVWVQAVEEKSGEQVTSGISG